MRTEKLTRPLLHWNGPAPSRGRLVSGQIKNAKQDRTVPPFLKQEKAPSVPPTGPKGMIGNSRVSCPTNAEARLLFTEAQRRFGSLRAE